jgi:hypothetical protein
LPVLPEVLAISEESVKQSMQSKQTSRMVTITMINLGVAPAALERSSVVAIAPGPAISGIASGKTAMSAACSDSTLSASRASRWAGRRRSSHKKPRKVEVPPRSGSAAANSRIRQASPGSVLRSAGSGLRSSSCLAQSTHVSPPERQARRPTGSTTSNSVTNADIAKSTKAHLPIEQKHAARHGVNLHQRSAVHSPARKLIDANKARINCRPGS